MHVRGTGWLARSEAMEAMFGAERWRRFLSEQKASFLKAPVLPISRIPVGEFLELHDALVKTFFDGDEKVYWRFGEDSAAWALKNQLRTLFQEGEARRFLQFCPTIYKGYFDTGELVVDSTPTHVDVTIRGVAQRHVYFEYSIVGFAVGGLRVLGTPTEAQLIKGFSKGDELVQYRFAVPQ